MTAITPAAAKRNRLRTRQEAAEFLGINPQTITNAIYQGQLIPDANLKTGKRGKPPHLFSPTTLREFKAARTA